VTSGLNRLDTGTGRLHQVFEFEDDEDKFEIPPIAYGSHIFSLNRNEGNILKTFENKMLKKKSEVKKAE
jgi:hypothetical protein